MNCRITCIKISTAAADRNRIAIFSSLLSSRRDQFLVVSQNIYECHCKVWQQRVFLTPWIFTEMNFSKLFETVALGLLSYLVMRIINHVINFLSYFLFPWSFFMVWRSSFFDIFRKLQQRNDVMGSIFFTPQVSGAETFFRKFSGIARTNNQ